MVTVKRLYIGLGICICLMLAGCGKNANDEEKEDTATPGDGSEPYEEETSEDEPTEDMTLLRNYSEISNTKFSWYIVRNSDHNVSDCDHSFQIEQYDAYYADLDAGDDKVIYLTFDCGYENGYMEQILDILKEYDAKACFFVTQTYIRDNVELVKRMKEEGHLVGNHTVTHPSMPGISTEEQKEELEACADYMKEATGYDMDMYFRPPSGEYSERVLQLAKDMGYRTIFWSMAYLDYDVNNQPGTDYVIEHFEKYYHNGAIPLIHNVSESNANALDTVLKSLSKKGYRFASLDEMFEK